MRHLPSPVASAEVIIGNRAPCTVCGHGLEACLRPGTDLRTWDGGPERIYWRHDARRRILVRGRRPDTWVEAPEQIGPLAAAYRAAMADHVEPVQGVALADGTFVETIGPRPMTDRPVFGVTPPPPQGPERSQVGWHPVCGHVLHLTVGGGPLGLALNPRLTYGLLTQAEIDERFTTCPTCAPDTGEQQALDML